jgi:hypothetical protein
VYPRQREQFRNGRFVDAIRKLHQSGARKKIELVGCGDQFRA